MRVPSDDQVTFVVRDFREFIAKNEGCISEAGMFIRTKHVRLPGDAIDFGFRLSDGTTLLRGRAVVIFSRPTDEGPDRLAGMGVRFTELDDDSRRLIARMVAEQVDKGGELFQLGSAVPSGNGTAPQAALGADALPEPIGGGGGGVPVRPLEIPAGMGGIDWSAELERADFTLEFNFDTVSEAIDPSEDEANDESEVPRKAGPSAPSGAIEVEAPEPRPRRPWLQPAWHGLLAGLRGLAGAFSRRVGALAGLVGSLWRRLVPYLQISIPVLVALAVGLAVLYGVLTWWRENEAEAEPSPPRSGSYTSDVPPAPPPSTGIIPAPRPQRHANRTRPPRPVVEPAPLRAQEGSGSEAAPDRGTESGPGAVPPSPPGSVGPSSSQGGASPGSEPGAGPPAPGTDSSPHDGAAVAEGDLVPLGPGVVAPSPLQPIQPRYPPAALRIKKEAVVVLRLLIDENGKVIEANASGGEPGFGFQEAAIRAARSTRFEPATKDGVRVKVWFTYWVAFRLAPGDR